MAKERIQIEACLRQIRKRDRGIPLNHQLHEKIRLVWNKGHFFKQRVALLSLLEK